MAESTVFHDIDLSGAKRLLEVGSGVGAQTEILLRRFRTCTSPASTSKPGAARRRARELGQRPWLDGRYEPRHADATDLPFEARSFDAAFHWILEHVPSPTRVLNEGAAPLAPARRCTSPR